MTDECFLSFKCMQFSYGHFAYIEHSFNPASSELQKLVRRVLVNLGNS